jgi:hypothetical protein
VSGVSPRCPCCSVTRCRCDAVTCCVDGSLHVRIAHQTRWCSVVWPIGSVFFVVGSPVDATASDGDDARGTAAHASRPQSCRGCAARAVDRARCGAVAAVTGCSAGVVDFKASDVSRVSVSRGVTRARKPRARDLCDAMVVCCVPQCRLGAAVAAAAAMVRGWLTDRCVRHARRTPCHRAGCLAYA